MLELNVIYIYIWSWITKISKSYWNKDIFYSLWDVMIRKKEHKKLIFCTSLKKNTVVRLIVISLNTQNLYLKNNYDKDLKNKIGFQKLLFLILKLKKQMY